MLLDNGRTQPKPDARSLQFLGSEEGIKDSCTVLSCNSDSVVRDGDPNGRLLEIAPETAGGYFDPYFSTRKRGFHSIANDIGEDLPQLCGKSLNQERVVPVFPYAAGPSRRSPDC